MSNRHGLILAGGRGTRFWPKSRTRTPKQLLRLVGERTLLQETIERLRPAIPPERLWILTNEHLADAVREQAPEVPAAQVLVEPAQRNTAPCLALATQLIARRDPKALVAVFPADHHIERPAAFRKYLAPAFQAASKGKIVTLGIQPRWPETGYGYLEFPAGAESGRAVELRAFREKPDLATAKRFLKAGRFFWNAGMFFWRASVFLDAMRRHQPKTSALLASLPPLESADFTSALAAAYPACTNISVDYAVMEPAAKEALVSGVATGDFGWNDLGSWNAVYELSERDARGNAHHPHALFEDADGCFVDASGKLVALVGVKDLVVVDTGDALLVVHRDRAQDVGRVVKQLEQLRRDDLL